MPTRLISHAVDNRFYILGANQVGDDITLVGLVSLIIERSALVNTVLDRTCSAKGTSAAMTVSFSNPGSAPLYAAAK